MAARQTFYYNLRTGQTTPATTSTDKNRAQCHSVAMEWHRNGDDVAIMDALTRDVILIWTH